MMREYRIDLGEISVGALLMPARGTHRVTLTLGHGAGAGMTHTSMQAIAESFADVGIATLRYNFPFKERGRSRVDAQAVSTATVAAALECAGRESPGPHLVGGHSYGGRMASHAVVDHQLDVAGLVFCSFPLHMPRKPDIKRAKHLDGISAPMLFLSGTRDGMAQPDLLNDVATRNGATVNWLDTADHGYKVLKRTRTRPDDVFDEMAHYASAWLDNVLPA
ncbi:MAG: alpha/beta fold hydrolase [Gammaproteobacteria bacterium]|nr:alpha/beta fold hydrolase [Gammaproteobacteria bacterium]